MKKLYMLSLLSLLMIAPGIHGMWWKPKEETAEQAEARREYIKERQHSRDLITAAQNGHLANVKLYIEEGIDINNTLSPDGNSALGAAAKNGQLEVVKYLLDKGADPTIKNQYGQTPVELAREKKHFEIVSLLRGSGLLGPQVAADVHEFKKETEEEQKRLKKEYAMVEKLQEERAQRKKLTRSKEVQSIAEQLKQAALALNINKIYELADQLIQIKEQ